MQVVVTNKVDELASNIVDKWTATQSFEVTCETPKQKYKEDHRIIKKDSFKVEFKPDQVIS